MNQDKRSPPPKGEAVTRVRSMTAAPKWRTGATMTKQRDLALPSRNIDRQDPVDKPPQAQHLRYCNSSAVESVKTRTPLSDYDQECFTRANVAFSRATNLTILACPLNMQGMPGALQVLAALLHGVQSIDTHDSHTVAFDKG